MCAIQLLRCLKSFSNTSQEDKYLEARLWDNYNMIINIRLYWCDHLDTSHTSAYCEYSPQAVFTKPRPEPSPGISTRQVHIKDAHGMTLFAISYGFACPYLGFTNRTGKTWLPSCICFGPLIKKFWFFF